MIDIYKLEHFKFKRYHEDSLSILYLNKLNKEEYSQKECFERQLLTSIHETYSNFGPIIAISPTYIYGDNRDNEDRFESLIEIPHEIQIEGKLYHLHAYIRRESIFDASIYDDEVPENPAPSPGFHYVAVVRCKTTWIEINDEDTSEVKDPFCFRLYHKDKFPIDGDLFRNRPLPHTLFYISNNEKNVREQNVSIGQDECLCVQVDRNKIINMWKNKKRKLIEDALRKSELAIDVNQHKVEELKIFLIEHKTDVAYYEQVKKLLDLRAENEEALPSAVSAGDQKVHDSSETKASSQEESKNSDDESIESISNQVTSGSQNDDIVSAVSTGDQKVHDSSETKASSQEESKNSDDESIESISNQVTSGSQNDDIVSAVSTGVKNVNKGTIAENKRESSSSQAKLKRKRDLEGKSSGDMSHYKGTHVKKYKKKHKTSPSGQRKKKTIIRVMNAESATLMGQYSDSNSQLLQEAVTYLTQNLDTQRVNESANLIRTLRSFDPESLSMFVKAATIPEDNDIEKIIDSIRKGMKNNEI